MSEVKDIPKGWEVVNFNDTCESISLNGIKIKQKEYLQKGKYPVIDQGQELIGGYYDKDELVVSGEPPFIIFGDHTKEKKFVNFKFIAGADGVKVLKPFEFVNPKLFFHFLHCIKIPDKGYARHFQFFAKEEFPLPPLSEQHRIVAKIEELFSSLDKGIESLKTAQAQLKIYRQALLKWAFEGKLTNKNVKEGELPKGWEWKKLGKLCETTSGGTPSRKNIEYYKGSIPWVKSGELNKGIIFETEEYITEEAVKNSSAKIFPKGTLLIALYGATIGKLAVLGIDAATNQAVCGIYKSDNIDSKYLYSFLIYKKYYLMGQAFGGAQPNISQAILRDLEVPIPPTLSEQTKIVAEIESRLSICDKIEESISTSLLQAEALRQSILKKAFEGKLVAQNPNDEPASVLLEKIKKNIPP